MSIEIKVPSIPSLLINSQNSAWFEVSRVFPGGFLKVMPESKVIIPPFIVPETVSPVWRDLSEMIRFELIGHVATILCSILTPLWWKEMLHRCFKRWSYRHYVRSTPIVSSYPILYIRIQLIFSFIIKIKFFFSYPTIHLKILESLNNSKVIWLSS